MNINFILEYTFQFLYIILVFRIALSWINHNHENPIFQLIYGISEPILSPFRNLTNSVLGESNIDFSPILAFLCLNIIKGILINDLF
tara:strand:+ start:149 stop:409 length:261 start_codon:yes stop_codon:yes gene_type:complete